MTVKLGAVAKTHDDELEREPGKTMRIGARGMTHETGTGQRTGRESETREDSRQTPGRKRTANRDKVREQLKRRTNGGHSVAEVVVQRCAVLGDVDHLP